MSLCEPGTKIVTDDASTVKQRPLCALQTIGIDAGSHLLITNFAMYLEHLVPWEGRRRRISPSFIEGACLVHDVIFVEVAPIVALSASRSTADR